MDEADIYGERAGVKSCWIAGSANTLKLIVDLFGTSLARRRCQALFTRNRTGKHDSKRVQYRSPRTNCQSLRSTSHGNVKVSCV